MSPTLLLDLDGTLVDSVPDIVAALNRMGKARGFALFDRAEVIPMVGDGTRSLLQKAFAARNTSIASAELQRSRVKKRPAIPTLPSSSTPRNSGERSKSLAHSPSDP